MTFLHLDDNMPEHPKIIGLTDRAFRLHVSALCYCSRHLTNGIVPAHMCRGRWQQVAIKQLSLSGLWVPLGDGEYAIHDYLDWNLSRADIEHKRAVARANARKRWHNRAE